MFSIKTFQYFEALPQRKQFAITVSKGELLADRCTTDCFVLLYQVSSFYVELYYHMESIELVCIKSFNTTDKLEPYLEGIDISAIMS
jgi:hypothetical protein